MRSRAWWSRGRWALGVLGVWGPLTVLAGEVDWGQQVLRTTGQGPPDVKASNPAQARLAAERSAKESAFTDLLERAKSLPVRLDQTVGDALAREETRRRVEEVLRAPRIVRKRYFSDGGVQWDVEVPLGALTTALEPAAPAPQGSPEGTSQGTPEVAPAEAFEAAKAPVTGLVVDARKLGMAPVLSPGLVDAATGERLYGLTSLDARTRQTAGVAGFFPRLEAAREAGRVGARPRVLEAVRLQGSDLHLGPDAVRELKALDARLLAEGRVAILIP